MRDALNYFLPIVEDDMNVSLNAGNTDIYSSITSNGYYGFQPAIEKCKEEGSEEMDMLMQPCGMEFNTASLPLTAPGQRATVNRKRTWEYGADTAGLKRRREDEELTCNEYGKVQLPITQTKTADTALEELLLNIHGCNFYHWHGHEL